MDVNANNKKIIQITEEALSPVHVPLVIGNEFYVVTQQDIRKVEDSRVLTYSKLMPNGLLKPLDNNQCDNLLWACKLRSLFNGQNTLPNNTNNQEILATLMQINQLQQQQQPQLPMHLFSQELQSQQPQQSQPQPMEVSFGNCSSTQTNNKAPLATIAEQLKWEKCVNTSSLFPFTCSNATSTTGLVTAKQQQRQRQHFKNCTQRHVQTCCSCCCCASCLKTKCEKKEYSTNVPEAQQNIKTQTETRKQIQCETQTDCSCDVTTTATSTTATNSKEQVEQKKSTKYQR